MKCVSCRKNLARPGKKKCQKCADRHNKAIKEKRANRIRNGLCTYCGEPTSSTQLCEKCKDRHNKSGRKRRAKKKVFGICINCGNKCSGRRCDECTAKHNAWAAARYKSRALDGICVRCGKSRAEVGKLCFACSKDHASRARIRDKKRKLVVFEAYGGPVCNCCGETILGFLTIDHINNDGASHRKEINARGGNAMYRWLKNNNYPSGFQVLCWNCNTGRAMNGGVCPHKVENNEDSAY